MCRSTVMLLLVCLVVASTTTGCRNMARPDGVGPTVTYKPTDEIPCGRPDGYEMPEYGRTPAQEADYCRYYPAIATGLRKSWPLLAITETDLKSKDGMDFEIHEDIQTSPNPALRIQRCDRIRLWRQGGSLRLEHTDEEGNLKAWVKELKLEGETGRNGKMYWAVGKVYIPTAIRSVGDYYVYRTYDDNDGCKSSEPIDNPCRRLHFEYFATEMTERDRPRITDPPTTITRTNTTKLCDGGEETNEGDGDEGRRRPLLQQSNGS